MSHKYSLKDFSRVVPRPANWRHTRLPIYITPDKVEKLLASCDLKSQIGSRDYAILILLSRLALRGCEVKNLNLDDIHWKAGEITVRGKGRESKMPLPEEVGKAIMKYIKDFRPKTKSRSVFVSVYPPYNGFVKSVSISGIVSLALTKANVESKHRGAHLLRHTAANQALRNGASLYEIAQGLRHLQVATTTIYAKTDFESLSIVMGPWLGGVK